MKKIKSRDQRGKENDGKKSAFLTVYRKGKFFFFSTITWRERQNWRVEGGKKAENKDKKHPVSKYTFPQLFL